jgi:uncharacterized membrane protein YiaA
MSTSPETTKVIGGPPEDAEAPPSAPGAPLPAAVSATAPPTAYGARSLPSAPESRLIGRGLSAPERRRLAAAIETFRLRVSSAAAHLSVREELDFTIEAQACLALAANEVRRRELDAGWMFLHEAERFEIRWLDPIALNARRLALASEAAVKLPSWRKEAVAAILKDAGSDAAYDDQRVALIEATRLRDEHTDNVYFRNRLLRLQMVVISAALLALVVGFVFTLVRMRAFGGLGESFRKPDLTISSVLASMTLGGIGACLSALITFANGSAEQKIPERLANVAVTATRPLIGAVSGMVAILMLKSGVLNLPVNAAAWIFPFVFGFSERLVIGALENQRAKT